MLPILLSLGLSMFIFLAALLLLSAPVVLLVE
jgi:hypothetical protein